LGLAKAQKEARSEAVFGKRRKSMITASLKRYCIWKQPLFRPLEIFSGPE
jgi:hypothetical protein